jgi:predicted PurR-regulated permease PerM
VILAVLAGAELGGIAGIFLAVPVVAIATVVGRHWLGWRKGQPAPFDTPVPFDTDASASDAA